MSAGDASTLPDLVAGRRERSFIPAGRGYLVRVLPARRAPRNDRDLYGWPGRPFSG
jgi:hypothetical protein